MGVSEPLFQALFEEEARPLTVSELMVEVRSAVERGFASVWVEGEVVNFLAAGSGHWYFTLNDGASQVKCVVWKSNYRIRFKPQNGIKVRIRGKLTVWETKGELKLTVESLEPAGEGALAAAYEQIKAKLDAEGLFADELKRPIPFLPRRVAVITSRSGAAYHDIFTVLTRRARSVSILLIPALVQGEGSADSIRAAIAGINKYNSTLESHRRIEVLIVGRGGGSAEDLWAFNDELLARAIRASEIPVISAVGHEIDWTIADLVCDLRAATPSAAAEMVAAHEESILEKVRDYVDCLESAIDKKVTDLDLRVSVGFAGLESSIERTIRSKCSAFEVIETRLTPMSLKAKAAASASKLESLIQRQSTCVITAMAKRDERLNVQMAKLDALSPLSVLTRGYSITQKHDGRVISDSAQTVKGDRLKIRLGRGKLEAEVIDKE